MNSKNILTVIGVLNILQGIGFFIGAETLTVQSFPAELLEGGGLVVGTAMHWPLSVACIVIGIVILSTRGLEIKDAKKIEIEQLIKKLNLKDILTTENVEGASFFSDDFIQKYYQENILDINPKLL